MTQKKEQGATFVEIRLSDEITKSKIEAIAMAFEIELRRRGIDNKTVEEVCVSASERIDGYVRNINFTN